MKTFVVIGLGRFGTAVAQELSALGHEVLAVDADGEATLTVPCGEDGKAISITTRPGMKDEKATYNVVTDSDGALKTGVYEVTSSENSEAVSIVDEEGQVFDYRWDGVQLTPAE